MKFIIIILFLIPMLSKAGPIYSDVTIEGILTLQGVTPDQPLLVDVSGNVVSGSVFPSQSGNAGKFLTTNGTLVSWGPVSTGTVTSVDLSVPSILSVSGNPITTSGTIALSLANQDANKVFSGPVSGGAAAPTFRVLDPLDIPTLDPSKIVSGVTNTFVGFNNSGVLEYIPGWSFNPANAGLSSYHAFDISGSTNFHNIEVAAEMPASLSANVNNINLDFHFDRNNTGESITSGGYTGLNLSTRHEGSGNIPYMTGLNVNSSISGNGGSVDGINGITTSVGLNTGDSVGDVSLGNFYFTSNGTVSGNVGLLTVSSTGTIGTDTTYLNLYNNSDINGNFRFGSFGNDRDVSENVFGVSIFQNGNVAENYIGYSTTLSGDAGSGTSTIVSYDARTQGDTISGNVTGFNMYNESEVVGNNNIMGLNMVSVSDGYRFIGAYAQNDGDMSEEIRGFQFNSTGDSRTSTGLDLNMSGNATADVRGIRVNMSSQTSSSTTDHVKSIETNGGVVGFQSAFTPFSSTGVDIGNNFTTTATINSGSPLTGTDSFIQFFQSNLLANDNISTGPFGLDTNMLGMVSQVSVGSGVNIPVLRSLILGTTVPLGSGGTIAQHVVLEMTGLPSFGGSVTNPTRIMVQDSNILGANFCDGATDCWGYKMNDASANNYFGKVAILTSDKKALDPFHLNGNLRIENGHFRYFQDDAPVATVDSNAGTGATCDVDGTDISGTIELTTGSGSWASGIQCAVAFDSAYSVSPKCQITAVNSNAASSMQYVYLTKTTTHLQLNFASPDSAATSYAWDYHCEEVN